MLSFWIPRKWRETIKAIKMRFFFFSKFFVGVQCEALSLVIWISKPAISFFSFTFSRAKQCLKGYFWFYQFLINLLLIEFRLLIDWKLKKISMRQIGVYCCYKGGFWLKSFEFDTWFWIFFFRSSGDVTLWT